MNLPAPQRFAKFLPWIFALAFIWMVLATVPLPPDVPDHGLDGSWRRALTWSHAQGFIFGKDVTFTYGPLAYLFYPIPSLVAPAEVFGCNWGIYLIFVSGAIMIWWSLGNRLLVIVNWIVLMGAMLLAPAPFERMQLSFLSLTVGIVSMIATRQDCSAGWLWLAGIFAGVMPLFKANEGVAAWATFYMLLTSMLLIAIKNGKWSRGKLLSAVLLPALAFLFTYIIVERNASGFWPYITRSFQIAMGYSEAMALPGPTYQVVIAVSSLAVLIFIMPLLAVFHREIVIGLLPALPAAFFAFKSGMVRQDVWHTPFLHIKLAVIGLLLLVCARKILEVSILIAYVAGSLSFGAVENHKIDPVQSRIAKRRALLRGTAANLSANVHVSSTWEELKTTNQQMLEGLQLDAAVSALVRGGTVDDVPSEIDIVEANDWRWKPRPIFQSYSAYTPVLDQLNASYLASHQSADHIIMQWEAIDGRYPLVDDAASWRSLFDNYDVEITRPTYLVLKRRDTPRFSEPRLHHTSVITWDGDIDVPEPPPGAFIMMRAEIGKSLYGILRGFLFRNSVITLAAAYASGETKWLRVTRPNLVDGAFITYLPGPLNEVLTYFGSEGAKPPDRVASIRFESSGAGEFSPGIRITWYTVGFRLGEPGRESLLTPGKKTVKGSTGEQ